MAPCGPQSVSSLNIGTVGLSALVYSYPTTTITSVRVTSWKCTRVPVPCLSRSLSPSCYLHFFLHLSQSVTLSHVQLQQQPECHQLGFTHVPPLASFLSHSPSLSLFSSSVMGLVVALDYMFLALRWQVVFKGGPI